MLKVLKKLKKQLQNVDANSILSFEFNDFIKLEIKEECNFLGFTNAMDNFKNLNIPIRYFIVQGDNINNYIFKKQTIYILNNKNLKFFIIIGNNNIKVSQHKNTKCLICETTIEIIDDNCTIHKYVYDLNRSTQSVKWYPDENPVNKYFTLSKDEAICLFYDLLNNLTDIRNFDSKEIVNILTNNLNNIENNKVLKI